MALGPQLNEVVAAFLQDAKERAPEEFGERLKNADNLRGIIGVLFDLAAAVPNHSSYFFHLMARLLKEKGGKWTVAGEFMDIVPPATRTLREVSGKTEESALADLRERWNTFSSNPTPNLGALRAVLGDIMAIPDPSAAPSAPAPPKTYISKVQAALTSDVYTERQRLVLLMIFILCYREAQPGTDEVRALEGIAGASELSLIDTLRDNANNIVAMLQGDDFEAAWSYYTTMRMLENAGLDEGDNRKQWQLAAAGFVRRLAPVFSFLLIGHGDRHPGSTKVSALFDLMDRLNAFAGLEPSPAFEKAKKFKALMAKVGKLSMVTTGLALVHILFTIFLTLVFPGALFWWSWGSTFVLLVVAAAAMIAGSPAQKVAGLMGALFVAPPLLTVALVLTTVFAPNVEWSTWWMTLLVAVGMDFVSAGLAQGAVNGIGAVPGFIKSLVPGLDDNEAKEMAKKVSKGHVLLQITSTVGGAIVLAWLPVFLALALDTPRPIRIGGMAAIVVVACAYGYLKRAASMRDYAKFADKLRDTIAKQDVQNLEYGYNALRGITLGVAALFFLVWLFGAESLVSSVNDITGKTKRAGNVTSDVVDDAIDDVEDTVRENRSGNDRQQSAASEAQRRKDLKVLDKVYGGDYCKDHKGYPCK